MLKTKLKTYIHYKLKYVMLKFIDNQLCHQIHDAQDIRGASYNDPNQVSLNL